MDKIPLINKLEEYITLHPVAGYDGDEKKDYFNFHKSRFAEILKFIEKNGFKNILEPGCYFGHIAMGARLIGKSVETFDLEDSNYLIKDRFNDLGILFKVADFSNVLPFEDESFDLIVLSEVFEHLPFHPRQSLENLRRLLKKDGMLLITTPNLIRLTNRLKLLFGKSIHANIMLPYYSGTHYREYTSNEISKLCKDVGYSKIVVKYIDFDYPLPVITKLVNKVAGIIPQLKGNLWLEITK